MPELLQNYSIEQIIVFLVILAAAIKGVCSFYDWAKERLNMLVSRENKKGELDRKVKSIADKHNEDIEKLFEIQDVQNAAIAQLTESVNLLLQSNKDEIKAWITEKHHYFVYELKYIDDYSLDCIEKRYAHYKEEGGNSFIADLMEDIRSLPVASSPLGPVHNQDKK